METPAGTPHVILAALGVPGPARATAVAGGADTRIWRIEVPEWTAALRLFRPEQGEVARREVTAMAAAGAAGLPVPRLYADGVWDACPALLLQWMPGRTLRDELRSRPWRAWALGVQFGRMQATIHAVAAPPALRGLPTSWIDGAAPDDALRACLQVDSRGTALLHFDYHPLNVLVTRGAVSAVLDWANARAGDPRADLARTASILQFAPLDARWPPLERVVRRLLIAGWRRGYREVAGPVTGMAPFYAWAGFVMIHDLSPRLGRPDLPWLTTAFLDGVRRWGEEWRERSRCPR